MPASTLFRRRLAAALVTGLGALLAATALAQDRPVTTDTAAEGAAPLDEYRIELIVFEYGDSLAGTTEDWPKPFEPEAGEPDYPQADEAQPELSPEDEAATDMAGGPPAAEPPFRFRPVPEEALELTALRRKLAQSRGYEPLLHVAWEQPGYDPETTQALDLARLADMPERLRGEARFYRSRFLHLALDLELLSDLAGAAPALPPADAGFGGDAVQALAPDVFRLSESRKLKSDELHYFDHPRYGVVARVTALERDTGEAQTPAADAAAARP